MNGKSRWRFRVVISAVLALIAPVDSFAQRRLPPVHREERDLSVRPASYLASIPVPKSAPPQTVAPDQLQRKAVAMSLDEAIRVALQNSEVIRVLAADTAVSTGRSVYDPAIAATPIDQARATFDPRYNVSNSWSQIQNPQAFFDLSTPALASIQAFDIQDYALRAGVTQTNIAGGVSSVQVATNHNRFGGFEPLNPSNPFTFNPLDPLSRSAVELAYTQPLLQGAGFKANVAPIVVAQIGAEISYYQLKASVQDLVRSVIDAYWAAVLTRVNVWVAQRQVEQARFAFERAEGRRQRGLADAAEVSQTRVAFANFRAGLVSAEGEMLQREAVLRNLLGLLPTDDVELVPVTPMLNQAVTLDWNRLSSTAEANRPDIAELKLAIEASDQMLILARNTALPRVDLVGLYRFHGLAGTTPTGAEISTRSGEFTDWTMGVNVSGPLGQREARAELRRQELTRARNHANLQQGIHSAMHELATSYRNVALFYEQYLTFKETREAAKENLDQQLAEYQQGRAIYLNVLQAITSWGDAVSSETQALARYNAELANLDRRAGVILELHGIELLGQNYRSRGPLAPLHDGRTYPESARPLPGNFDRYPVGDAPAEQAFELEPTPRQPAPMTLPPGEIRRLPQPETN